MKKFCCHVRWLLFMLGVQRACALRLTAHLSQSGLHGTVSFGHEPGGPVVVKMSLQSVHEASEWSWSVRRLPVDYLSLAGRCDHDKLGDVVYALDEKLGPLSLPANGSSQLEVPRADMPLTGEEGLWGKSLVLQAAGESTGVACGTITVSGNADEKFAEARFSSPVAGSVFLGWLGDQSSDDTDALLHVDLYHVTNTTATTRHPWKIYTTDILDSEAGKCLAGLPSLVGSHPN
ncbi:uncharacterized protein LOC134536509 [Bacillus rossius redtenbacheri]|uniref:uncharacterized protein LOC134536509 n=1 Tax=Bacillus rossius redtenbacheri TaxID=93214 RepID=UPI002FDCA0DA